MHDFVAGSGVETAASVKMLAKSLSREQYAGLSQTEADILKHEERECRGVAGKHEIKASVMSIQSIRQIVQSAEAVGTEKRNKMEKKLRKTDLMRGENCHDTALLYD